VRTTIFFSTCKLLVNLLLESTLRISTLLVPTRLLLKPLRLGCRRRLFNNTRIDIHTTRLTNTLCINLLGLNNKDGIRKRLLALSTRKLIGENLDFDTENTLTE
jgi:hypothetical protein